MNLIANHLQKFIVLYKQNLLEEVNKNMKLQDDIKRLSTGVLYTFNTILDFYPIDRFLTLVSPPAKIADVIIKRIGTTSKQIIMKQLQKIKLKNIVNDRNKYFIQLVNKLDIPQYYGGLNNNRITDIHVHDQNILSSVIQNLVKKYQNCLNVLQNRDESTIKMYENIIIPGAFIKYNELDMGCKFKNRIDQLYRHVMNLNGIQKYDFHSIKCIDLRNIETDGFDLNEEIEFAFTIRVKCRFLREYLRESNHIFDCTMKFDGDEQLIHFTYNET